MQIFLDWHPSAATSGLHAVAALAAGRPLNHPAAQAAWQAPATRLATLLETLPQPPEAAWQRLLGRSARITDPRELAEQIVGSASLDNRTEQVAALEQLLAPILSSISQLFPRLEAELELRCRPLREQWDTCGPGLLRDCCRRLGLKPSTETITVLPVYPVLGGAGGIHPAERSLRIEAMLANPHPQLPELVRLAWLVMRLLSPESMTARDLIPAVLASAEEFEAASCNPLTQQLAQQMWLGPDK